MLISPLGDTVLVTPTKTGTKSLEAMLIKIGYEAVMPRHRDLLPSRGAGIRKVLLPVRNPYDRLVSMYQFGISSNHSFLKRLGMEGFEGFCREWAKARDKRKPHDWTMLYSDYVRSIKEQTGAKLLTYKIEDGLKAIVNPLGFRGPEKHINRDKSEEVILWTRDRLALIGDRLEKDLAAFNYKTP